MNKYKNYEQGHAFLIQKFDSLDAFTKEELEEACGWPKDKDTFKTYWTKQFRPLLVPVGSKFRVSEVFRRFVDWERFKTHVTQNRSVRSDYSSVTYRDVMMFEFFMPLTNEGYLRTSLDALFYKDTVKRRLKANLDELKKRFPPSENQEDEAYLEEQALWVAQRFGGYSIGHVSGRYRAGELKSHLEAHQKYHDRYLVDETTAIVRFIIPFGHKTKAAFEMDDTEAPTSDSEAAREIAAARIRYFFGILFIQQIVEAVNGEDEIWLLESGFRSKLHIWSKS